MAKFMLMIHQKPGLWQSLSPEELQQKAALYQGWAAKFRTSGRHVSGEKLTEDGGKVLSLQHGRPVITDGPYAESKEVVGGYFVFRAADYAEAVELIRDCPFLDDGKVVLRQTDPMGCGGG